MPSIYSSVYSSARTNLISLRSAGRPVRCLRHLLLVMCAHPFAKEALTLHLARSEGHERYFGCNLMRRKVLASSHQHLMAEAPPPCLAAPGYRCLSDASSGAYLATPEDRAAVEHHLFGLRDLKICWAHM